MTNITPITSQDVILIHLSITKLFIVESIPSTTTLTFMNNIKKSLIKNVMFIYRPFSVFWNYSIESMLSSNP